MASACCKRFNWVGPIGDRSELCNRPVGHFGECSLRSSLGYGTQSEQEGADRLNAEYRSFLARLDSSPASR